MLQPNYFKLHNHTFCPSDKQTTYTVQEGKTRPIKVSLKIDIFKAFAFSIA